VNHQSLSAFIWSVADLLRGDYKQADYGKVILPFTVLRRLDCVLEPTKAAVLAEYAEKQKAGLNPEPFVLRKAGQSFANASPLDMRKLMGDQDNIAQNLYAYIQGFSASVRDIFERFDFVTQVDRLAKNKLLYLVTERFTKIDLHPDKVDNAQMGLVFEELIRKFAELSNETDVGNIIFGNTFTEDGHPHRKFDYMLSNPPFGVEWKKVEKEVRKEHETQGFNGRFGPGLPRVSDGSLLFLMHLLSKMRLAVDGGSRYGIVLNGSPLFTGGAGSGESEIRRYVLENDLLEAIIGVPSDMFYNTGISTYVWILSNRKPPERKGKVQLIDASSFWRKMRKSLGSKRKELGEADIATVTRLFGGFVEAQLATLFDADGKEAGREVAEAGQSVPPAPKGGKVKLAPISLIFDNASFGYRTITVERPLRDEAGRIVAVVKGRQKGQPQPDGALRDTENVPLSEDVDAYFNREVLPHAPDAWIDHDKTKVGYEIPFNRHFYVFEPPRPLAEIDADLEKVTTRIKAMIEELAA
jgi:type I restriction-modification system DNA methylase subunit